MPNPTQPRSVKKSEPHKEQTLPSADDKETPLSKVIYKIVEHAGGWAYQVEGTYSETFPSHEAARTAARIAAIEQRQPGNAVGIRFEDASGHWHEELSDGNDRPEAIIEG